MGVHVGGTAGNGSLHRFSDEVSLTSFSELDLQKNNANFKLPIDVIEMKCFVFFSLPNKIMCVKTVFFRQAALHCQGYVALLGSDGQSWGWNLVDNQLLHNSTQISPYPHINNPPKYQVILRSIIINSLEILMESSKLTVNCGLLFP